MKRLKELISNKQKFCDSCNRPIKDGSFHAECSCGDNFCGDCIGLLNYKELNEIEIETGHKVKFKNDRQK